MSSVRHDPESGIDDHIHRVRAAQRAEYRTAGLHRGLTLAQILASGARDHASTRLSFHSTTRGMTTIRLDELWQRAACVASGLAGLGLRPGDVICVQLPNCLELAVTYQAAACFGLVIVPVVPAYGSAELGYILRDARAQVVVLPTEWRSTDYFDNLRHCGHLPDLRTAVAVGDSVPADAVAWATLEANAPPSPPPIAADPDAVCMTIYTSGTTADPKGVQHSHNSVAAEMRWSPTPPYGLAGTVSLQPFPPGHTAGVIALLGPSVHGADTILMDAWDPAVAAEIVGRQGVTAMAGTPYFLTTLLDVSEREGFAPTRTLRHVVTGGAGVPPVLVERAQAAGWTVRRVYGATEQPSVTGTRAEDDLSVRSTTDGVPLTGNVVAIVDEQGDPLPHGRDGEIAVSGPDQFLGYTDAELNAGAFTRLGFFRTGDIGHLHAGGALVVTDRKKDIIIRGGENISSRNVEDVLSRHPAVAEVAVTGIADERYGERVCAFIVVRPGSTLTLEEVRLHFRALGVAIQKTPERLVTVDDLPRTAAGKVKKHALRTMLSLSNAPDAAVS